MKFDVLLELVGDDPVFESSLLLAGKVNPQMVRLQLSRWVKTGRIYSLRRGLYSIAPPYHKTQPHPFLVANHLQRASYVSLQSALAYHGLIPETVQITLSVSTGRPERLETPLGVFEFHHLKTSLLFGYRLTDLAGQKAFVATPEKALLDLMYLQAGSASPDYFRELRLQNVECMDIDEMKIQSERFGTPKIRRAVESIIPWITGEKKAYEAL